MLGEMLSRLGLAGRGADTAGSGTQAAQLPPELVAAIEAATVTFRHGGDDSEPGIGYAVPVVRVQTLGVFKFDGIEEAAERIERHWPGLSRKECRRAARLIAEMVGKRNRVDFSGAPRRGSWVMDPERW